MGRNNRPFLSAVYSIALGALLVSNASAITKRTFDFVIGVDGDFKAAIAKAPGTSSNGRYLIFVPNGEYDIGNLTGDSNKKTAFEKSNISLIGESTDKTLIYNQSINEAIGTTATLYIHGNDVYLQDMTIQNKSGGAECNADACRHVAVQQQGDKIIYKQVKLIAGQDTYYTKSGKAYWDGGEIQGTVDFICGGGDVFFEKTNLVMRRTGGYITASQNPGDYGYVFNNATLNASSGNINGTFYLGRSWGRAKTVFLNTKMYSQPKAEGWYGKSINYGPVVFAEYNSMDGNGNAINLNNRQKNYSPDKDGQSATLNPVLSASEATQYSLENVMGSWAPDKLTQLVEPPAPTQNGGTLVWDDNNDALCWFIFVNGKYKANVADNSYDLSELKTGDVIMIRTANSMGGLGKPSAPVTLTDINVKSFGIEIIESVGGSVQQSPAARRLAEGTSVTFTAVPISGWKFNRWSGDAASDANADSGIYKIENLGNDVKIGATFVPIDPFAYEAESGDIENGWNEASNGGFSGEGYVNFNTGTSRLMLPVMVDAKGEYEMTLTYANGSGDSRSLSISAGESSPEVLSFNATADWKTWNSTTLKINLPAGISAITFATVDGKDGPNLDKIELKPLNVEEVKPQDSTTGTLEIANDVFLLRQAGSMRDAPISATLYNIHGDIIRRQTLHAGERLQTSGVPQGTYLLVTRGAGAPRIQRIRINHP